MKRRSFIQKSAGFTGLLSAAPAALFAIDKMNHVQTYKQLSSEVIEWNAHLFSSDTIKYPFHKNATYTPDPSGLPDDPLAEYLGHLDEVGIDKAVVVHPEPYGDDHSLIIDALKRSHGRLKGTSLLYPKDPKAPEKLRNLANSYPEIISTRFHAHRGKEGYLDSFADPGVRALWRQAVDMDMVVELHIGPTYAKSAEEAIQAFPGCKVLIDHFAEPQLGNAVKFADILKLSDYPNVYMKFSGLAHFADDGPDFLSTRAFTKQVIGAFGPDRMVMGGVLPGTINKHMIGYSEQDIAKVRGINLQQLLDWH